MNDFYNVMYMIIHVFDIVIMYKLFGVFLGSKPKSKAFAALSYLLYYLATGLIYIFVDHLMCKYYNTVNNNFKLQIQSE